MINLSECKRHSSRFSTWEKLLTIRDPDIYFAESVRDFRENRSHIRFPWWKTGQQTPGPRAYVLLYNVTVERIPTDPRSYHLCDDEGGIITHWDPEHPYFPSMTNPDEIFGSEEQSVFVYSVFFCYLIRHDLPLIAEVLSEPEPRTEAVQELIDAGLILEPA